MIERLAIVIGAMKAGTTTLTSHLAKHPEITLCAPKEPGYFAFDEIYAKGEGWYEALFASLDGRIALEGSTDYTKFPHCPKSAERIRAFKGDVKLIYMVRHPFRRIESHARHVQRTGMELGRIPSPRADHSLDAGISEVSLDIAHYARQLDQYRDFFESGRLMIASLERLTAAPADTIKEVCEFLGVDPAPLGAPLEKQNEASEYVHEKIERSLWRYAKSSPLISAVYKGLVPAKLRNRVRGYATPRRKITGRFELTPQEETQLTELLAPDLERLKMVYGFDAEAEWGLSSGARKEQQRS